VRTWLLARARSKALVAHFSFSRYAEAACLCETPEDCRFWFGQEPKNTEEGIVVPTISRKLEVYCSS
jgi:hypothetical protein